MPLRQVVHSAVTGGGNLDTCGGSEFGRDSKDFRGTGKINNDCNRLRGMPYWVMQCAGEGRVQGHGRIPRRRRRQEQEREQQHRRRVKAVR